MPKSPWRRRVTADEQDRNESVRTRRSPWRWAWDDHRDKVMYLVVGGWNTLFSYACFSLCYYLLHDHVHPSVILLIAYLVASVNGFLGFRYIVFRSQGHPLMEYVRYQLVYAPLLVLNMVMLPLALKYSSLNAYAIQGLWAVFAIVAGYLGSKYFAFRRKPQPVGQERPPE
jgi:putative flippase GtrA